MIAAGKLRHRVTIEKPAKTRNSRGRQTDEWERVAGASAKITTLSGTDAETARQYYGTATATIVLRVRRKFKLETAHRIRFGKRVFEIGFIDNVDQVNSIWTVLVSEVKV